MTAQVHETIFYEGNRRTMMSCPPIPKSHPDISILRRNDCGPEKAIVGTTCCYRGYVGSWELKDGKLFLLAIKKIDCRYECTVKSPIFAEWFTGILRIPEGNVLRYVHRGFESTYEQEIEVEIEQGKVIKTQLIDNQAKQSLISKVIHWKPSWFS